MPFSAPGTIDGNPVGPDFSYGCTTNSRQGHFRNGSMSYSRACKREINFTSIFLLAVSNPFASLNCSIIPLQRSLRIHQAVYLIFIKSILSFGPRDDSHVIKRNKSLLTYYVQCFCVLPELRLPHVIRNFFQSVSSVIQSARSDNLTDTS